MQSYAAIKQQVLTIHEVDALMTALHRRHLLRFDAAHDLISSQICWHLTLLRILLSTVVLSLN